MLEQIKAWGTVPGLFAGVAALLGAFTAGWFSSRQWHKTPHERLKLLVEAHKDMPEGVDTDKVIQRAMRRELRELSSYKPPELGVTFILLVAEVALIVLVVMKVMGKVSGWVMIGALGTVVVLAAGLALARMPRS
ncbi:hypothetical protein IU468_08865 [Nocardia farcinica]|uniref:Transmembrane protein n=1 Tax=Nocardia farcinica (strain IFM 10152) TaxID=247156 RepID=Q5Z1Z8_NOCFA|nr:hypothetical protein [Nocardia farcinica]MBF6256433.1 hypothetical protein [Nocardia farcinica]BAD55543.1 hypothetical protein NFA_6980 [Nocardia farcinica IFM 10152]